MNQGTSSVSKALSLTASFLLFCSFSSLGQQSTTPPQQSTPPPPTASPADALPDAPTSNAPVVIQPTGPTAVFDTSMGRITCRLYDKEAPITVANFIGLATGAKEWTDPTTHQKMRHKPLYNGTTFHRVIPGFMIQGGDPTATGIGDPGYSFKDEFNPNLNFDIPGRLAMANSGPDTNGSQFFITEAPYDSLDQKYNLFGQCDDSGVEVVKSISRIQRDANDKPLTDVTLDKVTIVPEGRPLPPVPAAHASQPPAPTSSTPKQ